MGFPIRSVILEMNLTATLSKIGYLGMKRMMEKTKVNYSCLSIVQASSLKEILEKLELKRDKVTIESVDAHNM